MNKKKKLVPLFSFNTDLLFFKFKMPKMLYIFTKYILYYTKNENKAFGTKISRVPY